jgi:spore germination protein KA
MLRKPNNAGIPGSGEPPQNPEEVSLDTFRQRFADSADAVFGNITVGGIRVDVLFIDGLISAKTVSDYVLKPIVQEPPLHDAKDEKQLIDAILAGVTYHGQRKRCDTMTDAMSELLSGSALLVFEKSKAAVAFDSKGFDKRGITEPTNENVLKGSKESFIEVLRINTALIRRRMQTSALKISQMKLGRRTNTNVAVVYLEGIANVNTVNLVKQKLQSLDIDGIVSAGQIESVLIENTRTIFPQTLYTERPDKFCGNILEGRVGIIIDGMPIAYIVPIDLNSFIQAPEDYALNSLVSTLFRIMRYLCVFVSLVIPAFYVSITTFHQEMIPTKLAVSIISSKQGVPFPTYMEVLMMLLAFEVLLEAGLRLPRAVGQAVSIVGALVVGQAAIAANILSPGVVIIIAAAGITGFVVPSQDLSNAVRVCRIGLVLLSTIAGLFTTTLGLIFILYHMCALESLGTPYLSPFASNDGKQMFNDTIVRKSWVKMKDRPVNVSPQNAKRES